MSLKFIRMIVSSLAAAGAIALARNLEGTEMVLSDAIAAGFFIGCVGEVTLLRPLMSPKHRPELLLAAAALCGWIVAAGMEVVGPRRSAGTLVVGATGLLGYLIIRKFIWRFA